MLFQRRDERAPSRFFFSDKAISLVIHDCSRVGVTNDRGRIININSSDKPSDERP